MFIAMTSDHDVELEDLSHSFNSAEQLPVAPTDIDNFERNILVWVLVSSSLFVHITSSKMPEIQSTLITSQGFFSLLFVFCFVLGFCYSQLKPHLSDERH
jgi:hypothetical protein